ncbi:MAG: galactose oxidase [Mucilaginibacter sp.]|uniref:galactose oxidase n=1 Tax=Mucilaginibacter sp. TaxID=1882438 RepID=UPI003265BCF9
MKFMGHKTLILFISLLLAFCVQQTYSQNQGLRFSGQNNPIQDNRTSLDLSPDAPLCLKNDFELAFKINFLPNSKTYFGYIVRVIDNRSRNIDLMMYDPEGKKSKNVRIIIGEKFSNIEFNLDSNHLYNQWNRFKLKFDRKRNTLTVYVNDKALSENSTDLRNADCFKMLFGANLYNKFRTTDVPDMRIKDIQLSENGKPTHHWPLDEINGNIATDKIQNVKAKVANPVWIKSMHYNWEQVSSFEVKGNASVGFNPKTEQVYIISTNALYSYSVNDNGLKNTEYKSGSYTLLQGNQSLYDTISGKLYNINIDKNKVTAYSFVTQKWDAEVLDNGRVTQFWHANKFISDVDQSLYVLGGYGELKYKKLVQKSDFSSKPWAVLLVDSTVFGPRYLAALGQSAHTGNAYIIGGYGSLSGLQMLNPRNYYDLVKFNVKTRQFNQVYKFSYPGNDFAFANSLIIDTKSNEFYGLIFPNQKFKSNLQLIKGTLTKPEYQIVGNSIPYHFYDIRSFADLYYCPASKKLVAVTLFRTDNQTEVKIYTIGFPPNMLQVKNMAGGKPWLTYLLYAGATLVLLGGLYFVGRRFKTKKPNKHHGTTPTNAKANEPAKQQETTAVETREAIGDYANNQPLPQKSSVFLFGNLQVFDAEGNNVSRLFTPLLKELFLLILIYSIRRKTGVSSEKLNEILWFDKSKKDALNNRSVNIAKLKTILEKIGNCELSKTTGYWKIEIDHNQAHVDYRQYLSLIDTKQVLDKQKIQSLFALIQRGSILLDTDYEWLDEFKTEVTNEVINRLLLFARSVNMADDPEILIQTTNHIFHFDPVNEDAMQIQCKVLALLGKHSVSKHVYEKFVKEYKNIYNEDYNRSFHSIIE